MPDNTTSQSTRTLPRKLRRIGFIYRVTACVFALSGLFYAVNIYRHVEPEFDISMSVLQFALAIVFFAVGAMYYRKADAEQRVAKGGTEDK